MRTPNTLTLLLCLQTPLLAQCLVFPQAKGETAPFIPTLKCLELRVQVKPDSAYFYVTMGFANDLKAHTEGRILIPLPEGVLPDDVKVYNHFGQEQQVTSLDPSEARVACYGLLSVSGFDCDPSPIIMVFLQYQQALLRQKGLTHLRFPLRAFSSGKIPLEAFGIKAELALSDRLGTFFSPSHALAIKRIGDDFATGEMGAQGVFLDRDLELIFSTTTEPLAVDLLTYSDGDQDSFLLSLVPEPGREALMIQPRLTVEGVVIKDIYPEVLPNIHIYPLQIYGHFHGSGRAKLHLEGTSIRGPSAMDIEVEFRRDRIENDFIPTIWAQRRVGALLDQHADQAAPQEELVALARRYAIATPFPLFPQDLLPNPPQAKSSFVGPYCWGRRGGGIMPVKARILELEPDSDMRRAESRPLQTEESKMPRHQLVAGRAFYLHGEVWVDSNLENVRTDKRLTLTYASADYFAFMERHPETRAILALGERVSFLHDGTIVTVQPAS